MAAAGAGAAWALFAVTAASAAAQSYLAVDAADAQKKAVRRQENQAQSLLADQKAKDEQAKVSEINVAKRRAASFTYKAPKSEMPSLLSQPPSPTSKSLLGI